MSYHPCIWYPGCGAMVEGGCSDCPAEAEDDDEEKRLLYGEDDDCFSEEEPRQVCPTCRGEQTVNPLTAPEGFFCTGTVPCPTCDGAGEF